MKNAYCKLPQDQIRTLPKRFLGFLLSPFQFNLRGGMVGVPEDTFQDMIDVITECAVSAAEADRATPPSPSTAPTDEAGERAAFKVAFHAANDGGATYDEAVSAGLRAALASRPVVEAPDLRAAAQSVVARWNTPKLKDEVATAYYIDRLRDALAAKPTTERES